MGKKNSLREDWRLLRHARDWRGRSRVPRSAQPHAEPDEPGGFPTAWARTEAAGVARVVLQRAGLKPVTWSQTRPVADGLDHLERLTGPALFVANHSSHLDTAVILGSLPRRITDRLAVGAAADYFFDSWYTAAATTLLFNAFPIERRGSRPGRGSLAADLVDDGWSLLLYPEASRTPDGWLGMFRVGPAQLCVQKGIPAVPIAVRGAFAAMPRGRFWPRPGRPRVCVRYGRPLHVAAGESAREFRDRIASEVARLWAEDDLGWYRALRASVDGALPVPTTRQGVLPTTSTGEQLPTEVPSWRRVWEATRPSRSDTNRRVWTDE